MMVKRRLLVGRAAVACTAVLAVAGLTGGRTQQDPNGVEDLPAAEIAEKGVDATKGADSLRIKGGIRSDEDGTRTDTRVDLALNKKGDCEGTVGIDGATAEIVKSGKATYLKGDSAFWKEAAAQDDGSDGAAGDMLAELLKGRWLKVPAGAEGTGDLAEVCDLDSLLKNMDADDTDGVTKGKAAEVDGKPAITLTEKEDGGTTTVYVATEDEPYILKVTKAGGDEPGEMTLTDYNKPVKPKAPPADEVVDLDELSGPGRRSLP
ncbi:hypothetical protein [Streptomyces sp. SYSU K217416]